MQYADLNSYFMSRFNIYRQLAKVHYYYASVNLAAILEIIIKELADTYRKNCTTCKKQKSCKNLINKNTQKDLKALLQKLNDLQIINLPQKSLQHLFNLIDIRNFIHLRLMSEKIINNENLSVAFYNNCIISFKKLMETIDKTKLQCNIINN